jgi:alpha-mannosidase
MPTFEDFGSLEVEKMPKKYKAIMVSKTHWDREHSRPFEQFRWHLVYNVMDKLMEIYENVPEYKSFMFDGQSLGIWDYLEIRPEREPDIERYVKEGRLVVGPFFVGPDEFIPSGESLIRNLLMGHKIANQFGGVMKIGYNPDAFGHIAQLPQILRGFGIDAAVFSRGVGEDVGKPGTEFLWEAPDGSEIIAVYNNYGNTAGLSTDLESALNQIKNAIKSMQPKELPYFLLSNGSDGSPPQAHVPEVIKYANEKLEDTEIFHGTLQQYIDLVRSSATRLPRYRGELRWGRYNLILGGVYSARTYLKQANAQTQTLLEKYAEPFAAFAYAMVGDEYPAAFFSRAWHLLLQNHFHDTICACSQDKVYHDAMMRYAQSQQIAEKLKERSLKVLVREIQTQTEMSNATALIIFNPLSFERTEVATKKIYLPVEAEGQLAPYVVKDAEGKVIPSQIRHQRIREHFQPTFWDKHYPTGKRMREFDISFIAEAVPPCGYKTYYLCPERTVAQTDGLSVTARGMENTFLSVSINPNGTLNLTDKCSGQSYSDLHFFEDVESVCGEYNHYTSPNPQVFTSLSEPARITLVESGPICATFKIELEMLLPEAATEDVQGRSEKLVPCPITTYVTLSAHSRRLDFRTIVDNRAKDHRLRVRFPTGIRTDSVHAEGQFHVIQRNIQLPDATGWAEPPVPEHPHQTFVSLTDGQRGFTLINKGLPEYAAENPPPTPSTHPWPLRGGEGGEKTEEGVTLSLTLLRSVGWIGREFFVTAAYKIPTPDAQCLGRQEFEYALVLHEEVWRDAKVWRMAHGFNAPFEVAESSLHAGSLPKESSVISLQPDELIITAIKKSENDDALVIRLYNISDKLTTGRLTLFSPLQKAMVTNLLEEFVEEIPISNDAKVLVFPVKGHQIVTLKIWLSDMA